MAVSKYMLGMNARNFLFIRPLNKRGPKDRADDKLRTKRRLLKHSIPTPSLLGTLARLSEVRSFDWSALPKSFVLKPAHGYGGEGIMIVRGWDGQEGKSSGEIVSIGDVEATAFDILDGAHSIGFVPDTAIIEERVIPTETFRKIGAKGVPDVRVIVYGNVPVMAMLRLPTIYSGGRANLHLGGIGIGIDMRTGITTHGVYNNQYVTMVPGTKTKVHGIKIPQWDEVLSIAVRASKAVGLGFSGIDIVFDKRHGPLVLEVNARPGLTIQRANRTSLHTRLDRIEGIDVDTPEQGVEIAKKLFAEKKLVSKTGEDKILGITEKVTLVGPKKRKVITAKIDTGAYRTSIDSSLVDALGLEHHEKKVRVRSGVHDAFKIRDTVDLVLRIRGKEIKTIASCDDRSHMRFRMIVGRKDLGGFLVDPTKKPQPPKKRISESEKNKEPA